MLRLSLIATLLACLLAPAGALAADDSDARVVLQGPVVVDREETTGDVIVGKGDVTVRGTVDGDILVADGVVTIRGTVTGSVTTFSGQAILGRRANVKGDIDYGDKAPERAKGSKVGGEVQKFAFDNAGEIGGAVAFGVWLAVTVSTFLLGLLLLLLFPRAADAVAKTAKSRAIASALVGLLLFILIPILAIVLCITVLGLPLGVGLLLALLPLYGLAYTTAAFVFGRFIIRKGPRLLAFVVGLVILRGLALIPIAGGIVWFLVTVFALGALFVTALRARS